MSIRVTCPGCHTRFNVSEKFAGRDGPCPKCRATIRIPDKGQEVVIHAPVDARPKGKPDPLASRPIFRREVVISPLLWTVIFGVVGTLFAVAVLLRWQIADKVHFPLWVLIAGAMVVAIPTVYAGYGVLRDSELGAFMGRDLWIRIAICAGIYAALWLVMPVTAYAVHGYDTMAWLIAMTIMIALGGAVAMSVLDFDYLNGVLHYGMYLGCALLLRWVMGVGIFPGQLQSQTESAARAIWTAAADMVQQLI